MLIVDDPDAPDPKAPIMIWGHWVVINIPTQITNLVEGLSLRKIPPSAVKGLNDWKNVGYEGPCPPIGRHSYFHKLYALDTTLKGIDQPNKAIEEKAMEGHVPAEAVLIGSYEKSG